MEVVTIKMDDDEEDREVEEATALEEMKSLSSVPMEKLEPFVAPKEER